MPEKFKEEVEFFRHSSKLERSKFRDENIKMLAERVWKISGSKEGRDYENWKIAEYIYDFISETTEEVNRLEFDRDEYKTKVIRVIDESKEIMILIYKWSKKFIIKLILPKNIKERVKYYVEALNLLK